MINYIVGLVAAASVASAVDISQEKADAFEQKTSSEKNASGLTQANCYLGNKYWVSMLPWFQGNADTWPCSYAGTIPANEDGSHQMFFWMYPAIDEDAPVAIWLNGGPGASSTFANFLFSSPLRINQPTADSWEMYTTEDTWIKSATMIYIDQPIGTGFSYGEPLLTTMDEAADEFMYAMKQLWGAIPGLANKDLYVTGESYAGKYIPRFSWALHEDGTFNLKASLIGDPYTAPLTQRTSMYIVPEALNILDDSNMPQIAALRKTCQESLAIDIESSDELCANIMGYISEVSGDVYPYDQRIFAEDWNLIEDPTTNYFSAQPESALSAIYKAIHVDASTKTPIFEMSSSAVGEAFVMDNLLDYSNYVEKLIAAQSPVLIYAGEFDAQDGPKTQEPWLRRLNFEGSDSFWSQSRQIYWVQNSTSTEVDLINGGYWRTSDYFEFLTVPKSGHFVPNNYYSPTFSFFTDYINSQKLVCHEDLTHPCSTVTSRCNAMNNCNGQGTCDQTTAQCVCNAGYKFADCSKKVIDLTSDKTEDIKFYGPGWFTMQYSGTKESTLSINANITSEVYILKDKAGDPNNFVYDMSFKSVTGNTTFSAVDLGLNSGNGYSVAVYVPAIDENANELLNASLSIYFIEGASKLGAVASTLLALVALAQF